MNKKLYLIIYDITDNKRRRKVSKILEKYGIRIQFLSIWMRVKWAKEKKNNQSIWKNYKKGWFNKNIQPCKRYLYRE